MRKTKLARQDAAILVLLAGFIAIPAGAEQSLLRIVSPSAGTVVRPGQTVSISVAASPSVEKLAVIGQRPLGVGETLSGSMPAITAQGLGEARPVQFVLRIPAQTQPGIYRLTAFGRMSGGDLESEAVTIDVERSEEPVRVWIEPSSIQFEHVGDRIPVRVLGTFADGSQQELTKSSKTNFISADPRVARVSSDGVVTSVGPGKTSIQARTPLSDYSIPLRVR